MGGNGRNNKSNSNRVAYGITIRPAFSVAGARCARQIVSHSPKQVRITTSLPVVVYRVRRVVWPNRRVAAVSIVPKCKCEFEVAGISNHHIRNTYPRAGAERVV